MFLKDIPERGTYQVIESSPLGNGPNQTPYDRLVTKTRLKMTKYKLPKRFPLQLDIQEMDIIIQALFESKNSKYIKLRKSLEVKLYGSELIRTGVNKNA